MAVRSRAKRDAIGKVTAATAETVTAATEAKSAIAHPPWESQELSLEGAGRGAPDHGCLLLKSFSAFPPSLGFKPNSYT